MYAYQPRDTTVPAVVTRLTDSPEVMPVLLIPGMTANIGWRRSPPNVQTTREYVLPVRQTPAPVNRLLLAEESTKGASGAPFAARRKAPGEGGERTRKRASV